jgi:iduronate 2-sulfatase
MIIILSACRRACWGLVSLAIAVSAALGQTPAAPKCNVLFIISDDMRCEPGTYGGRAVTPNIDRLAKESVRFDAAYCQFPLCNPSRSSLLTGRYPGATGVIGNRTWFGEKHPDYVSLPKYFKQNGYVTLRSGKIFHEGIDDTDAWTVGGEARTLVGAPDGQSETRPAGAGGGKAAPKSSSPSTGNPRNGKAPSPDDRLLSQAERSDRWLVMPGNGESDGDYQKTTRAIELLRKYKDQPFFMGFGLSKPHSPPGAPQKFYDLYDLSKITLPPDFAPRPTVPPGFPRGAIRPRNADLFIGRDASEDEAKEMIRAYLASCSYADSNVGRILDELDALGLREKTVIVFWADHGYELGEKGKWSKAGSLFEEAARTPLTIYVPNSPGNGKACARAIECVDLYPTLVELCGLPMPPGLEGRNLAPLVRDPDQSWDRPAFTIWSEDGQTFTGIAVREGKWRYAEYVLGGALLLDMEQDPHQMKNLAHEPEYAETCVRLSALIKEYQEKHGLPK